MLGGKVWGWPSAFGLAAFRVGNRFHDKRGGKVVKRYGQLPCHPRRVAGIPAGVGDKAARSRGQQPADL